MCRRLPNGGGTIEPLTTRQRAHLKSLAHALKPVHHIGREGVTDQAVGAVRDAFNRREILKVKVLDAAPEAARETGEALAARLGDAHLVQVIGRTLVLYRPDPDDPEIELP
jgi:RNA-binding protein